MSMVDTHPRSPFRKPDWRWLRANLMRRDSIRAGRRDDDWVRRARRIQNALDRTAGDLDHRHVARTDPPVLAACRLRLGDERCRWELEARLLAAQNYPAIDSRTGIPAGVVEAYEALFFNVKEKLGCMDWVGAMVFGPRVFEGLAPDDVELIWKVLAYGLGPVALDALVGMYGGATGGPWANFQPDATIFPLRIASGRPWPP